MSFGETRLKVLTHELGHWLVARHLGFSTGEIEITIHLRSENKGVREYYQDGSSMVYPAPVVKSLDDLKDYLDKRFQVLYAGIAAQTYNKGMTADEIGEAMELDAGSDLRTVRELAPILRGMIYGPETTSEESEKQCSEMLNPSWEKSLAVVTEIYPKIEWIGNKLAPRISQAGSQYAFTVEQLEDLETQFQREVTKCTNVKVDQA